jgi:hypothetical protein
MKQYIVILGLLLNSSFALGQVLKPDTDVPANHTTYNTHKSNPAYTSMMVKNRANKLDQQKAGTEADNLDFRLVEPNILINSFKRVFSSDRLKQLLPEHGILISCYINSSGKILEVSFILGEKTSVTATEIEALEEQIKKNVMYKFKPGVLNEKKFYVVSINMKYEKVLAAQ